MSGGYYVEKLIHRPLANQPPGVPRPQIINPAVPIRVQDGGKHLSSAVFMASVSHREEKGSDVNLATPDRADVLNGSVDAVVVVTNDSDLKLPLGGFASAYRLVFSIQETPNTAPRPGRCSHFRPWV